MKCFSSDEFFERVITAADVAQCLSEGADPNSRDEDGWTPLHHAARDSKTPEVVKALLDAGANPDARDKRGRTPLHLAATRETPEVVKVLLVDAGADPKAKTKDGKTPVELIPPDSPLRNSDVYSRLN